MGVYILMVCLHTKGKELSTGVCILMVCLLDTFSRVEQVEVKLDTTEDLKIWSPTYNHSKVHVRPLTSKT